MPSVLMEHALRVECPVCGARIRERCTVVKTGKRAPTHAGRWNLARERHPWYEEVHEHLPKGPTGRTAVTRTIHSFGYGSLQDAVKALQSAGRGLTGATVVIESDDYGDTPQIRVHGWRYV